MSLEKTALMLSLPKRRVRELIVGGFLAPLVSRQLNKGAAAWLIPKVEIDRFHVQTLPTSGGSKSIPVRDILKYWRLREHEGCALIAAVADGHLLAEGNGQRPVPIGAATLNVAIAKEWLQKHRTEERKDFSVDAAARALRIKQQVAYDLVHRGLLRSTNVGLLGHRVSSRDIERFQTTYVSLASLAGETRRSPRALLAELFASPVCGPSIDGTRQYFYRRADIDVQLVRKGSSRR